MLRHFARLLVLIPVLLVGTLAVAHDSWISRGGHRNAAGEWCCGEGDCFAIPPGSVEYTLGQLASTDGTHVVWGYKLFGVEFVPETEAMPSPDGQFWRCKRPDGTRRCFFAPPPNT